MRSFSVHKTFLFTGQLSFKVLLILLFFSAFASAQKKERIEILRSGYGESAPNIGSNVQRLVDSVFIRHENILMWCDTAFIYTGTNKVDAIGKVHINQGDTLHLYANNVFYDGDISFARAWNNVELVNKTTHLFSDTLDYDLDANVCYFNDNGKIVDSTTTVTSKIGKYFIDDDNVFFYENVNGYNDDFTLISDTVQYNTVSGRIYIDGPTTIKDSANTLYAEDGWYDSSTGEAELMRRALLYNSTQQIDADYIKYNKELGTGRALGSVRMEDRENRSIILGNIAEYNEIEETAMVTDSAVYMSYTETDTLYLHADTLRTTPDTVPDEKIITAYYGVRFFRTDLQGLCDSLVYFTKDSIVQLYKDPIIWSEIHQLTAENIEMKQITDAPDELHLSGDSYIISKQDSGQFDQIKGKEMIGYIVDQELSRIDVNGNGQTLYYAREENEIIGLNRAESSKISILFKEGQIFKIIFRSAPEGELKPILGLTEEEKKLPGFDWKNDERPLTKHDIFPRPVIQPLIDSENTESKTEVVKEF